MGKTLFFNLNMILDKSIILINMERIKAKHIIKHKTKREVLLRFLALVFLLIGYFIFLSWKYGMATGGSVLLITWSIFVLCTPIADAGFLLDFPVRLLFNIKMVYSEIAVWTIAIVSNILFLNFNSGIYESTLLTRIFKQILTNPFPYWIIILLSLLGTFLSVLFGDELLNVIKHKDRHIFHKHGFIARSILLVTVFVSIVVFYNILIAKMGINTVLAK